MLKKKSGLKKGNNSLKKSGFRFKFGDTNTLGLGNSPKKPIRSAYKSLKKQSNKHVEGKEQRIEDGIKMMKLFDLHWNTHPDRKCEACGVQLCGDNLTLYHDHLVPKSKFEVFKFDIDCLFLCCGTCHTMKESGFPLNPHKKAIEEFKLKHNL